MHPEQTSQDWKIRVCQMLEAFFTSRNIRLTQEAMFFWIDGLSDLSVEEISNAFRRFNRESTDFPTPAAIRKFAGTVSASDEERAAIAWDAVRKAISSYGCYANVDFDDPLANAAIKEMGGWLALCDTLTKDMEWRKKDFIKSYSLRARIGIGDGAPLLGMFGGEGVQKIACGLPPHPRAAEMSLKGLPPIPEAGKQILSNIEIRRPDDDDGNRNSA